MLLAPGRELEGSAIAGRPGFDRTGVEGGPRFDQIDLGVEGRPRSDQAGLLTAWRPGRLGGLNTVAAIALKP